MARLWRVISWPARPTRQLAARHSHTGMMGSQLSRRHEPWAAPASLRWPMRVTSQVLALGSSRHRRPTPPGTPSTPPITSRVFAGKRPLQSSSTTFRQACPFPSSPPSHSPSLVVVAMSDRDTGRTMEYRNVVVPGCHTALNLRQVALCYPSASWCTITSAHLVGTQRHHPKGHDTIPERRVSIQHVSEGLAMRRHGRTRLASLSVGFQVEDVGDGVSCSGCPSSSNIRRPGFLNACFLDKTLPA
jgi:hypothetical protein